MANENEFLLHALAMGIFVSFIYDVVRVFRRVVPHNSFLVSLEDLGFWVYCGGSVFLLMYHESNGELRWFAVCGAMAGMLLYGKLCSPFFVKYVSLALSFVLNQLCKVAGWLLRPFKSALCCMGEGACRVFRRLKKRVKMKLTYLLKMLKMGLRG